MLDKVALKRSTFLMENLIRNGDFRNGLNGWHYNLMKEITTNDGVLEFLGEEGRNSRVQQQADYEAGDKIYISGEVKATSSGVGLGRAVTLYISHSGNGEWERLSRVVAGDAINWPSIVDIRDGVKDKVYAKCICVVNLTQTFGAGNEPTAKQMDELLAQFPDSWFDGTKNVFSGKEIIKKSLDLDSKKANRQQEEWLVPTLINGWESSDENNPIAYYKDDFGVVRFRGRLKVNEGNNGTIAFSLPSGYRPHANIYFNSDGTNYVAITTSGAVQLFVSRWTSFQTFNFRVVE